MKKIYLFSLFFSVILSLDIFAIPICSYPELTSAIRSGNGFVILLDLQQCTGNPTMPLGYFTPRSMMLMTATETTCERVVTSNLHFTDWSGKPTYEYVKYTINSDNTVIIRTTFYDPQSFNAIGSTHTINCSLGKGLEIHTNNLSVLTIDESKVQFPDLASKIEKFFN